MRVLAVGAHPDDLEILCGGTLARFVQEGHEVVMCHATRGDRGSFVHSSEEIARIRGAEARRATEICGPSTRLSASATARSTLPTARSSVRSSISSASSPGPDPDPLAGRLHG